MSQTQVTDPKFMIEVKPKSTGEWERFTTEPLIGEHAAHIQLEAILAYADEKLKKDDARPVVGEDIRIVPYTLRDELWDLVLATPDPLETARLLIAGRVRNEEDIETDIQMVRSILNDPERQALRKTIGELKGQFDKAEEPQEVQRIHAELTKALEQLEQLEAPG